MDYPSQIERRFLSPNRKKDFKNNALGVVSGEASDRTLNVWVRLQIQVIDSVIQTVHFNVYGCPHTVAVVDWAAEWLEGQSAKALVALDMLKRRNELGVPVDRLGKLLLIEDAAAVCKMQLDQLSKQGKS